MKIEAVRIRSFKSFEDTEWIDLGSHFTVLVGQNNSGKSAFLNAFKFDTFMGNPHRSGLLPAVNTPPASQVSFRISIAGDDARAVALSLNQIALYGENDGDDVLDRYFTSDQVHILDLNPGPNFSAPQAPNYGLYRDPNGIWCVFEIDPAKRDFLLIGKSDSDPGGAMFLRILEALIRRSTFVFNAERYSIGRCEMTGSALLNPDASNLGYMLFRLNKDHKRWEEFQALVHEVLPTVRRVLISPVSQQIEISIQSHETMRADLAIPLDDSGTGVAQILAILYVVVAYDTAQLIIDEPNSFLHPGATRRLLGIFKRYTQHQFLLSTHSADVISQIMPEKLLLLQWNEEQSQTVIECSSGRDLAHIRTSLAELDANLSDVFGYEAVVFVEGPTERDCFPLFVTEERLTAVNFVAMREASALTSDRPDAMFDVYAGGVDGTAVLPARVRFSFDRDSRDRIRLAKISVASKDKARFLPRRMYEHYLLHPAAISAFLQQRDGEKDKLSPIAIQDWMETNYGRFRIKGSPEPTKLDDCDAATLLETLFVELTDARWEYRKVEYGRLVTEWILANDPDHLTQLREYVRDLLAT